MQKVKNAAARLIPRTPGHQHCTPLLQRLHWPPISEGIKCKTAFPARTFSLVPLILLFKQCRKSRMLLHVLCSEHHAFNTAYSSYARFTGLRFLKGSNAKLSEGVTTLSLVPPPLIVLSYCSCTALPALSAFHQTYAYSNSDALTAKLMAFALSPISVLTSGTTSPKTSDTLLLSLPVVKTNSRHFSSLSISNE